MKTYVLYHADCMDGLAAAWVLKMAAPYGTEFFPVHYNRPMPQMERGSRVYLVDFCYPLEILLELVDEHQHLIVFDHHASSRPHLDALAEALGILPPVSMEYMLSFGYYDPSIPPGAFTEPIVKVIHDVARCGSAIAWGWAKPGKPLPRIICYVQDRDLWTWKQWESRAVNAYLRSFPMTLEGFSEAAQVIDEAPTSAAMLGRAILDRQEREIEIICKRAYQASIGGHVVPSVNATNYISEVGEKMLSMYPEAPFSASYFVNEEGQRVYSLRSRPGFDVSEVATKYGGGGHPRSAGFTTTRTRKTTSEQLLQKAGN